MVQTKSRDQTFLRQFPQGGQITNLDCNMRLPAGQHCQKTAQFTSFPADFTESFEVNMFNKTPINQIVANSVQNIDETELGN